MIWGTLSLASDEKRQHYQKHQKQSKGGWNKDNQSYMSSNSTFLIYYENPKDRSVSKENKY